MGPTASGKSALAQLIAEKIDGVILNADAMQCYADLQIITARPSDEEMARWPHRLYGIWPWDTHGNAALWRMSAISEINDLINKGKSPILVGGTGLYIRTLMEGLAPIPRTSEAVRQQVGDLTHEQRYERLLTCDPLTAAQLKPGDKHRVQRALEIWEETGRSQIDWHQEKEKPAFDPALFHCFRVDIPRDVLYERINQRFDIMMEMGALEEAQALISKIEISQPKIKARRASPAALLARMGLERFAHKNVDHTYPLLKSHGLPELMAYLHGEMSLEAALDKAKQHTRNYAKRQETWLRNQMQDAVPLPYNDPEMALEHLFHVIPA
jgi:tRNA dimethylallyltransferase